MTVGGLLDFIDKNKIPRDAEVFYQRIEDVYFEKHNWKAVLKEGYNFFSNQKFLKDGVSPEVLKEQYIGAFCPVKYKDDNNLYIDAHY